MQKKKTIKKNTKKRVPVKNSAPKNPGRRYELIGIAFLTLGIISLCGLWGLNVGFVGFYFAKVLSYLFGIGAHITALLVMLIGLQYILKHHGLVYSKRFFGLVVLYISILAVWHHFVVAPGAEILPDSLPGGGGLLGGGLLLLLRRFFGVDGGIIVLGAGIVGSVLLSTTWSLAEGMLKTKKHAETGLGKSRGSGWSRSR